MSALTLARAYQHSFETYPNITLALTGGCLNSLGDFVAQVIEKKIATTEGKYRKYDIPRTLRFFVFGFTISPFLGRWNCALERWFPLRTNLGSRRVSLRALSKRVACDQIVMAPIGVCLISLTQISRSLDLCQVGVFLSSMALMERRDLGQIKERFNDLYRSTVLTNWKVWPLAQLINFRYMPLAYRIPFQSGCGVFWTLYLSLINARERERQDQHASLLTQTPHR
ncbi:hypothetical protein H2248_012566 [Termitomyces sp. 'cryptogamus']|nr:hypothetical protein H2248_012566 [Termitomyces sp. 'cryptogamus']